MFRLQIEIENKPNFIDEKGLLQTQMRKYTISVIRWPTIQQIAIGVVQDHWACWRPKTLASGFVWPITYPGPGHLLTYIP